MQIKKRLLVGGVCGALLIGTMVPALAATVHYNDGSTVGGSALGMGEYAFAAIAFLAALAISGLGLLAYRAICRFHERRES